MQEKQRGEPLYILECQVNRGGGWRVLEPGTKTQLTHRHNLLAVALQHGQVYKVRSRKVVTRHDYALKN